ncbi:MAG: hypothetical protein LUD69_08225, partial [Oscillospiraceae bacterium]|nr:hypothetical protein [Oscillospiraceae bacterium]
MARNFATKEGAKVQEYCIQPSPGQHSWPGDGFSVALVQNHCQPPQTHLISASLKIILKSDSNKTLKMACLNS